MPFQPTEMHILDFSGKSLLKLYLRKEQSSNFPKYEIIIFISYVR